jgi:hypothetical protein
LIASVISRLVWKTDGISLRAWKTVRNSYFVETTDEKWSTGEAVFYLQNLEAF